jgi:hypothetical protein
MTLGRLGRRGYGSKDIYTRHSELRTAHKALQREVRKMLRCQKKFYDAGGYENPRAIRWLYAEDRRRERVNEMIERKVIY